MKCLYGHGPVSSEYFYYDDFYGILEWDKVYIEFFYPA